MKRRSLGIVTRVVAFLLLGAIVNVAVAWGCSLWSPLDGQSAINTRVDRSIPAEVAPYLPETWLGDSNEPSPYALRMWRISPAVGCTVVQFAVKGESMEILHVERAGWPWHSIRCWSEFPSSASPAPDWNGGMMIPWFPRTSPKFLTPTYVRPLPYRLLWPGFAYNMLFYAGILWLAFAAPFALRRRRRVKRGLCPACAYPVGESDVCTECGEPVKPRRGVGM